MSRDPRVFEAIEDQTYEQNEDRIRALSASLNGLSRLLSDHLRVYDLNQAETDMVREELLKSLVKNNLDHLTHEQIIGDLDQIEVGLESNNEE